MSDLPPDGSKIKTIATGTPGVPNRAYSESSHTAGAEQLEVGPGYGTISLSSREAESDFTSTSEALDADELLKTSDCPSRQISDMTLTTDSELASSGDGDYSTPECGWGPIKPDYLQRFRSPKVVLICFCLAGAIQSMVVNGFVGITISSIEKRFDLASTESGFIMSAYDVASVLCLIPVSYIGGIGHKPRWLGTGILILGMGAFLYAMPHFTAGVYSFDSSREHNLCFVKVQSPVKTNESVCTDENAMLPDGLNHYKYAFIFAMVFIGMGATPLYTLGVAYLDENLKTKMSPVYIGVFYSMAIIGPAVGYLIGGEFLKRYTDLYSVDISRLEIGPDSPQWVGAWWIGFLMAGVFALFVSVPILAFPKHLPGAVKLQAQRVSEAYRGSESAVARPGFGSIRDIPMSVKVLLTNPTFMFLNLAGASEGMIISGFTTFAPKFVEAQFNISAGIAAQLIGFATIPAGGGGTFLGGYLVKKFDLKCAGIIKLCLITSFTSLILTFGFLVRCSNVPYAGVNVDYTYHNQTLWTSNISSACNAECHCEESRYAPVCGGNDVMYYSACHAGCHSSVAMGKKKVFYNCSCVDMVGEFSGKGRLSASSSPSSPSGAKRSFAKEGKCQSDCQLLWLFLPVFGLVMLFTFTTSMPALSATLRCVPEKQRSFALGIQWIIIRCLGTIPAPVFFGVLIDKTCQLWQQECHQTGSCLFYDNTTMGHYLLGLAIICKALVFAFFFMSLILYRPPPKPSNFLTLPGEQMSQSSTLQMINRSKDRISVESQASRGDKPPTSPKYISGMPPTSAQDVSGMSAAITVSPGTGVRYKAVPR